MRVGKYLLHAPLYAIVLVQYLTIPEHNRYGSSSSSSLLATWSVLDWLVRIAVSQSVIHSLKKNEYLN